MIGRERAVSPPVCAAEIGQLLGVQLDRQAERPGRSNTRAIWSGCEGDALAEAVDRIDQPFGMGGVERGQADLVDIGVGRPLVFRRHGMGAEETGH
jgi:hypothetical protein